MADLRRDSAPPGPRGRVPGLGRHARAEAPSYHLSRPPGVGGRSPAPRCGSRASGSPECKDQRGRPGCLRVGCAGSTVSGQPGAAQGQAKPGSAPRLGSGQIIGWHSVLTDGYP